MSLYKNFLSVGGLTLLSRVVGFVRDALMAAVLGTGPAADAFFAAFRFPNLFRRLFAEGAFNTAFVPMFAGALEAEGEAHAKHLAARIMAWLTAALLVITVLAELFMPVILIPFVPGFADQPEKFELTVLLTRILFPYLACMSLMAAYGAILNSLGRFFAAAFAPVLLNVVSIAVLVPLTVMALEADIAAIWVAIATLFAGFVQLLTVWIALRRTGFMPRWQLPRIDREVRSFWMLAVPAILTGGITQINIFVGTIIASNAQSAISYLYYADRLYQLPLGIIGIAIGTVLLPELTRHLNGGRTEAARASQEQSVLISMLLSVPAAVALSAIAVPIVRVLFERGAFDAEATVQSARALVAFSVGLPAFVLVRVLQPGFFARKDTITPTIFAGLSAAANIGLSLALFPAFEHVGIALATSLSAWLNTVLLMVALAWRGHFALTASEWLKHLAIFVISLAMGGALWALGSRGTGLFASGGNVVLQAAALGAIILFGILFYFTFIHITRVQPMGQLLRRLRRG
ncbi:putative lipid II flippase MurJ [Devosia pacifica]|uniref:Probable lipid II flippase MurJ n=1 Tax=Devosia pacifica TaxID=1335967 RepID=A0A918VRK6_9HYPH|nr:murein biosynthesis integral membrane protein MurJ [Devosia pacifica]GHA22540.1 putative lipid II flippase MurJ [Devosia pacifica]